MARLAPPQALALGALRVRPLFSILIPHRDDLKGLIRTLEALSRLSPSSPSHEVVVADNGSVCGPDSVRKAVDSACRVQAHLILQPHLGAGLARNAAVDSARGQFLAFLDCDCVPEPDWLLQAHAALGKSPIVGGPVVVRPEPGELNAAQTFDMLFGFNSKLSFERDGLLLSANLIVEQGAFRQIGPFRIGVSEDREWCLRASRMGFPLVLVPTLAVAHFALGCRHRLFARWRRITVETYQFQRFEGRGAVAWLLYLVAVAGSPFWHWTRIFSDPRLGNCHLGMRMKTVLLLFRLRFARVFWGLSELLRTGRPKRTRGSARWA